MFGISIEHVLIVGVILLFVGPKRLPELGSAMGKSIKNFKDSFKETPVPAAIADHSADKRPTHPES